MNFISVQTSIDVASVSLFINDKHIETLYSDGDSHHSRSLPLIVEEMTNKDIIDINKIDYIAVSIGPGSYAGIKAGTSFVKGFAYGLNIPVIPINSIEAINFSLEEEGKYYIAIYSHRDYVYCQRFNNGKPDSEQLCVKISKINKYKIIGYRLSEIFNGDFKEVIPDSINIGYKSIELYNKESIMDYDNLSPNYLKISN